MAVKTKKKEVEKPVTKYTGAQLLKMDKYKTTVARVVIKPDGRYSFEEADTLISYFMKKKG